MTGRIRSVLVIGAGVAGLACAGALARAGVAVTVLERGRRVGGRVATCRVASFSFNHGAQFATARGPEFSALLADLRASGRAVVWPGAGEEAPRLVFLPGMQALPAIMAQRAAALGVAIHTGRQATALHAATAGWHVRHQPTGAAPSVPSTVDGELSDRHDAVLIAVPAPRAVVLLATARHAFAEVAAGAVLAPCWAVMMLFSHSVPGPNVWRDAGELIAWAAREGGRPGRAPQPEGWILHASAAWSRAHIEDDEKAVIPPLVAAFRAVTGAGAPDVAATHRWRDALVETPIGQPCLWDPAARLGACGDWCLGGRIEAAYDSGLSLAQAVLDVA
jgi:hypothetical protein